MNGKKCSVGRKNQGVRNNSFSENFAHVQNE